MALFVARGLTTWQPVNCIKNCHHKSVRCLLPPLDYIALYGSFVNHTFMLGLLWLFIFIPYGNIGPGHTVVLKATSAITFTVTTRCMTLSTHFPLKMFLTFCFTKQLSRLQYQLCQIWLSLLPGNLHLGIFFVDHLNFPPVVYGNLVQCYAT